MADSPHAWTQRSTTLRGTRSELTEEAMAQMDKVLTSMENDVAIITLNNPGSLNAWDMSMQAEVTRLIKSFDESPSIETVVITGAGDRAFCAGQDLAETGAFSTDDVDDWLDSFLRLYDGILSCKKPVVAAINGIAAGSGYQLALVCDVRVAHHQVKIGQPEVSSGIPSVTGQYLTDLSLGHSRTVELMLSGRLMDAQEALEIGLLHALVAPESVMNEAVRSGLRLASQPKLAFELTKRRIRDRIWPGLVEAFEAARGIDNEAWGSGEPQETSRRFFEQRQSSKTP